jgi:uncharacterized cupin superfamily protein
MKRTSIADPEITYDEADPDGFRAGMFRIGALLGAKRTGASVYELPPGQALCPYHYECGEEEWLLVLDGEAAVRHPEGTHVLRTGDVAFFETGPAGAHQVRNDSDLTVRVLMWSEVVVPTATVYPDSDKVGVWTGNEDDDVLVRRSSRVDYYDGEAR